MKNQTSRRAFITTSLASLAIVQSGAVFAQSAEHTVDIKGFAFKPANIQVKIGDTITFVNADAAPHTATSSQKKWGTKRLNRRKAETLTVTADFAGEYFCKFHPNMKGTIEILA